MVRRFLRRRFGRGPAMRETAGVSPPFADRQTVFETGRAAAVKIARRYIGAAQLPRHIGEKDRRHNPLRIGGDAAGMGMRDECAFWGGVLVAP